MLIYVFSSLSLQPPDQNLPKFPNHSILYIMYGDPVLNRQIESAIIFAMSIRGQHQILHQQVGASTLHVHVHVLKGVHDLPECLCQC